MRGQQGGDGTVRLWDIETGHEVGQATYGHASGFWSVAASPDGRR